jgi:two-component sensor histidine kinase
MKKTALYLFFFIQYCTALTAQLAAGKPLLSFTMPTDSIQLATKMMNDGLGMSATDTARALRNLRTAARIFSRHQSSLQAGRCTMAVADIFFKAGMYNRAFNNYLKAQDSLYETGAPDFGYAMLGVAKSQYHRGLYRFALKAFSDLIEYAVKNKNETLKAAAAEYLGLVFFIFQSTEKSRNYFTTAFFSSITLNDEAACLRLSEKLFDIHYFEKRFDSALWYADYSYAKADKMHLQNTAQVSMLNRIAALIRLRRSKDAWQELMVFDEVQAPQSDLNVTVRLQALYGDYFLLIENNTEATARFNKAIQMASVLNTPDLMATVYSRMADAFAEKKDYEKAYRYALRYYEMMSNFYSNSISYLSRIESLIKEDVANSTIKFLHSTNRIKELQLLRELDLRNNLQNESLLKDSILLKEKQLSQALVMENTYKSQQLKSQQLLSTALNHESLEQRNELRKEYIVRIVLSTGLVALFILGLLAWHHYRKSQSKKRIIEKQAADMQVLMKEIHHRVKNNLQIISSLLDIQSLSLAANNPAAQAIREGKNRVQSMAIIHQFLYHENNIRGISIEDYIKNLSENLFASYNINPDNIQLETDIDRLNLDIDTVIPLGLIINELVSNSLKYAFKNGHKGTVLISLKQKDNSLQLTVKDNGRGFPEENGIAATQHPSFGLQLIAAFAQKLKASLTMYNDNGAVVAMQIKKYKLA